MRITLTLVAIIVLGLAASGCNVCSSNTDCPFGELCSADGQCVPDQTTPRPPGGEGEGEGEGPPPPINTCGGSVLNIELDPDRVYILGTLAEGSCGQDAVSTVDNANNFMAGFDCNGADSFQISSDGRMVYKHSETEDRLRVFVPEGFRFDPDFDECVYPDDPVENDGRLETPRCAIDESVQNWFLQVGGSDYAYNCEGDEQGLYHFNDGSQVTFTGTFGTPRIIGWTRTNLFLITDGFDYFISTLDGTLTEVTGLPDLFNVNEIVRTNDSTFYIAFVSPDLGQLYEVGADGVATDRGPYEVTNDAEGYSGVMAANGDIYFEGRDPDGDSFTDAIWRFSLNGPPEMVYTEADDPKVKLHISYLMSGGSKNGPF